MFTRRTWILSATTGLVALAVVGGSVIAAELLGTVKSVDADARKFIVTEKGSEKDTEISVNDDTVVETPKGKTLKKFDLAKLKKGSVVQVTHENGVASKIVLKKGAGKKKAEPKN